MTRNQRGDAELPPGPARELVALLRLLRSRTTLTVGQISGKSGLAASHVSEVLRGWKTPSPNAAEVLARTLGADARTLLKARSLAESATELNRYTRIKERQEQQLRFVNGSQASADVDEPAAGPIPERLTYVHPLSGSSSDGKSIGIVTGDLRRVRDIDVWVNSENTDMKMSRFEDYTVSAIIRYDGALRDEAGRVAEDTIADELAAKVAGSCPLAAGTAVVTGSGRLAASHGVRAIVHVAAVYGEPGEGYRQIRDVGRCVTNALTELDRRPEPGIGTTVLFPLLGTGQGRGGIERTAAVLVGTAAEYLAAVRATRISTVWFLAHTYRELDALRHAVAGNRLVAAG